MTRTREYNGKTYYRSNTKWTDENSMVVPLYLQNILNTLSFQDEAAELSYDEAKKEGDRCKASDSHRLAINFYEVALKKAESYVHVSVILPRITSCYRKIGQPEKVVALVSKVKADYVVGILNKVLLTSCATAY